MQTEVLKKVKHEIKELLVDGLDDANDRFCDFKKNNPFEATRNCYPAARWDCINDSLKQLFLKNNIPYAITKKGFWELLLFCNGDKQIVFSVMRKDRFIQICNNPEKESPQYFEALVSFNEDLEADVSQMVFDGCYKANDKYNQKDKICDALHIFNSNNFNHVVVVFNIFDDVITSIELYVVNDKFEICENEDIIDTVLTERIPDISENPVVETPVAQKQKGLVKLKVSAIDEMG